MKISHSIIIILIVLITGCQKDIREVESGVTKELATERKELISDLKYDLHFIISDSLNKPITGSEKITFNLQNSNKDLILDFRVKSHHVNDVLIDGKSVGYVFKNDHIIIPADLLKKGKNTIEIDFVAGDQSLNRNEKYLYSLFVPDRASTAFPCFDQPDLKARYTLQLTIPEEWEALTNGSLRKKESSGNQKILAFNETRPISTYLFAFTAGKYNIITQKQEDREIKLYHRETDKKKIEQNVKRIFELQFNSLEWLEKYTGIDYPFNKFDIVAIPSFQYSGMEHPGAIYYRDSKLFLDETASVRDKLGRANLINHETAHIWFGDLVTMNWFNEVWLKEVFANFIADKITQPQFPEINHDLNFLLNHYPSSYSVDRTSGANPIQQKLDNLKNAGTLYGSIIYHKAPIVMGKLENQTGEKLMQDGLRKYLSDYQYGTATWSDLIHILDKYTDSNLETWSDIWVNQPGMPHIYNEFTGRNKLKIVQNDPLKEGRSWRQNLNLRVKNNEDIHQVVQLKNQSTIVDNLPVDSGNYEFIIPNAFGKGYGYFKMDEKSKAFFLNNITAIENDLERTAVWINLWENLLNYKITPENFQKTILTHLPEETNAQTAELITGYLETNFWKFLSKENKKKFAAETESILWNLLEETQNKDLKSTFFNSYISIAFTDNALKNVYSLWKKDIQIENLPLTTKDFTNTAFEIMLKAPARAEEIIKKQIQRIEDQERQNRFRFISKALDADEEKRDRFFESLKKPENREKEPWVSDALHYIHHPLRAKSSVKYIKESLEMLPEIQATGDIFFPKSWVDATLWGHNSSKARTVVKNFIEHNPDFPQSLKNKILQSSDLLYRAVEIRKKQ